MLKDNLLEVCEHLPVIDQIMMNQVFNLGIKPVDKLPLLAVKEDYLDLLKYLLDCGHKITFNLFAASAYHGSIKCLNFAHENNYECPDNILYFAAGNLDSFKYVLNMKINTRKACDFAALRGCLKTLEYAYSRNYPISINTCLYSVKSCSPLQISSLPCLKFLREKNCEWGSSRISEECAKSGNLEALKYALETGCGCDINVFIYAEKHPDLLKYLLDNDYPGARFY